MRNPMRFLLNPVWIMPVAISIINTTNLLTYKYYHICEDHYCKVTGTVRNNLDIPCILIGKILWRCYSRVGANSLFIYAHSCFLTQKKKYIQHQKNSKVYLWNLMEKITTSERSWYMQQGLNNKYLRLCNKGS